MTPDSSTHVKGLALPIGIAGMLLWMCISELWPNSGNNSSSSRDEPPDLPGVVLSLCIYQCKAPLPPPRERVGICHRGVAKDASWGRNF